MVTVAVTEKHLGQSGSLAVFLVSLSTGSDIWWGKKHTCKIGVMEKLAPLRSLLFFSLSCS